MIHSREILPSYRLLTPPQRELVDGLIARLEPVAIKQNTPLLDLLRETLDKYFASFTELEQAMLSDRLVISALYYRAEQIDDRMRLAEATIMKADQVIIAAHLGWFYDFETQQFKWSDVTPDQMLALESMEVIEKPDGTVTYKIKLHNKHSSLERQSKIMQMQGQNSTYWADKKQAAAASRSSRRDAIGEDQKEQSNAYARHLEKYKR